ncbi:MAG TPA: hypothetical protein VFT70_03605 [Nocardioides sp.]|nr:hypothetical protein [Nocardioides sp.]
MGVRKNKSLLDQTTESVSQYAEAVKPHLETAVTTAKEKAGPALADAKAKAAPVLADARAKAAPVVASGAAIAAEKIAAGASIAAEKAADAAQAAADKVEEVATPPKKKGSKLRKLLLLTGLAAAAAFVAKKLQGGNESQNWQSSYTPTPAPRPANEEGGASPDEAIADSAEAPHPVTTPDEPADVVDIDDEK